MDYRVWYSTESFADFIIANTDLSNKQITKKKMYESDANNAKNFHTMPDHICFATAQMRHSTSIAQHSRVTRHVCMQMQFQSPNQ